MAGRAVSLEGSRDEAVDLALMASAGLRSHGQVLQQLKSCAEHAPVSSSRLFGHLLAGKTTPSWHCHQVQDVIVALRERAPEESLRVIGEQALRLGCIPAADA